MSNMLITLFLIIISLLPTHQGSELISDTITTDHTLKDNGETIVSSGGAFELGFFSPGNSKNRYVGIWYKNIAVQTVVWVANRVNPVSESSSGTFKVVWPGILVLVNHTNGTLWSTNASRTVQNPIAQLLDSGNLVVKDANDDNPKNFIWQSFDYPSDTLLPGMKLGWDLRTRLERRMISWKSPDDPSPGELSYGIELDPYPQTTVWKGDQVFYRGGPWNGHGFSGGPELKVNPLYNFEFVSNQDEVYYMYTLVNESMISRLVVNNTDSTRYRYVWVEPALSWRIYATVPRDYCDSYGLCGPNGVCDISGSPYCQCLKGFGPKLLRSWNSMDWSQGCVRRESLDCAGKSDFVKISNMKLPDTVRSWVNISMSLKECKEACLKNCSCMAYINSDVTRGGSGCVLWFGDLLDIRLFSNGGQDLYVRMPYSKQGFGSERRDIELLAVILFLVIGIVLLSLSLVLHNRRRKKKDHRRRETSMPILECMENQPDESHNKSLELPMFDLPTLSKATDDFSLKNKLGEGGFGPVFKGVLEGQDIAVKRLSITSSQGVDEFKNEILCTAKLQHRNLVKLLGCCIQGKENMLVYEYLTNKSLDLLLFDAAKSKLLDWPTRLNIIHGIARGLMYLHQDSRLRVIHRDLKASNVLLDSDMNPKISDFGLARAFGGNETGASTTRVVGTYGYMSPEYAVDGIFSVKSDVYSFGVLVLEIVSGRKNRGFSDRDHSLNLVGHAWMLYVEQKTLDLVHSDLTSSCHISEVMRSVHIGLLCVQEFPDDRPTMSCVVQMLGNETVLSQPKQPGFFTRRKTATTENSTSFFTTSSTNEMTITQLVAR